MSIDIAPPEDSNESDDQPKFSALAAAEQFLSGADDAEAEAKAEEVAAEEVLLEATKQADSADIPASAETTDTDEDDEFDEEPRAVLNPVPDDGVRRRWYAIHAHSGQEASVQNSLQAKAEQQGLTDQITNIFVPMEEVAEFKSGEKKLTKRKYFPGYILVQLPEHPEREPELWHLIKETPGVTGFIGSRTEPVPLEDEEVNALVEEIRGERERPRPKVLYEIDERVKIIDGAFANFMGNVAEINEERGKMKIMIEIFERQTSVEVEFWQVEKQ